MSTILPSIGPECHSELFEGNIAAVRPHNKYTLQILAASGNMLDVKYCCTASRKVNDISVAFRPLKNSPFTYQLHK